MSKYFAYLLRIWPGGSTEQPAWRASLENPHTREILAFDSVERLCAYLRTLILPLKNCDQPPPEGGLESPPKGPPIR